MPNIHHVQFYGVDIGYTSEVLTPRLETEVLVKFGIQKYLSDSDIIIDIWTGSGAIISAVAKDALRKDPQNSRLFFATDISSEACKMATYNFSRLWLPICCEIGNLLEPFFSDWYRDVFRSNRVLCFANLPYISENEEVGDDVLRNDPHIALYGGWTDGFECIRNFLTLSLDFSRNCNSMTCLLEFWHTQAELFVSWCQEHCINFGVFPDQAGIYRFGYYVLDKTQ